MEWGLQLTANAWTDEDGPVSGQLASTAKRWATRGLFPAPQEWLGPSEPADETRWEHESVGWGLILAEPEGEWSDADKAAARDAPESLQTLVAARGGAPVLRYRPELKDNKLRRYYPDRPPQEPELGISPVGIAPGRIPRYLLIYGDPATIPWSLQYALNRSYAVGRLDLEGPALDNYLTALIGGWKDSEADPTKAVVWTVDTGADDITSLMRRAVADPIATRLASDQETAGFLVHLPAESATGQALIDSLAASRPAVIVTTSHGKTGPLDDPEQMITDLGLLVDQNRQTMTLANVTARWQPDGAIWYAHACCSAGSAAGSGFAGLLEPGSLADRVVTKVGDLGARIAPLPRALLGASKPLRAFVGHIEPTFDWTLRQPDNLQLVSESLVSAVYPNLYLEHPVGLAFKDFFRGVGELWSKYVVARDGVDAGRATAREDAFRIRLTAHDRQSMVILGDPTVAVPPLPSRRDS
jgi:hypothetical protein